MKKFWTHFGKIFVLLAKIKKSLANIFKVYLVYAKVFNPLWHNFCAFGQFFIYVNGQMWKNHLITLLEGERSEA